MCPFGRQNLLVMNHLTYNFNDNDVCIFCGSPFIDKHHIVPKNLNGSDTNDNIISVCANHHRALHFLLNLDNSKESNKIDSMTDRDFERKFNIYKYILQNEKDVVEYFENVMLPKIKENNI